MLRTLENAGLLQPPLLVYEYKKSIIRKLQLVLSSSFVSNDDVSRLYCPVTCSELCWLFTLCKHS